MYNFANALNYDYERLISLPDFNGVHVHVYNCMHVYGFVCWYRVLFCGISCNESIFFSLFSLF